MTNRIITDISNYISVSYEPKRLMLSFCPVDPPEQPEYTARIYRKGYTKWLIPPGGVSDKRDKCPIVRSKADLQWQLSV